MPEAEHPIDIYMSQLARRLHLPAAERDQVLAEVRTHLEERAGALQETGVSEEHAERQAVLAFGPVRRISRELRASHPVAWGKRRWVAGVLVGAAVFYALYLLETVPLLIHYDAVNHLALPPLDPGAIWYWSGGSMLGYFGSTFINSQVSFFLWLLLPLFMLYPILPFRWGRQAQHWWVPGFAYGLGTCLLVVVDLFSHDLVRVVGPRAGFLGLEIIHRFPGWDFVRSDSIAIVWVIVVCLPLALAASFVGWWWRERSTVALGRAQTA